MSLKGGGHNLLVNCARLTAGERLLVIAEDPNLGWYDAELVESVAEAAQDLGARVKTLAVGRPSNERDPVVSEAIAAHDCIIFFARLGDQIRFEEAPEGKRYVMCYVRDREMLAGPFGRAHYQALAAVKSAVDGLLLEAQRIEISCGLGTDYVGRVSPAARQAAIDVSVRRFPVGVPLPIDGSAFSGRVALSGFLTPTGSQVYEPAALALRSTLFADVEAGRIVGFSGEDADRARAHYKMVAEKFGIDRDMVHSWHAGIHPGCVYPTPAADNPDRWSNTAFCSPRFVHFHTCGGYAPGEICWMVLDQTIRVDGIALWSQGRLCLEAFEQTAACLADWPVLKELLALPPAPIGLP